MTTKNNKYTQAVRYGSVELALTENFVTVEGLLEWLAICENIDYTIDLAYNAICKRLGPNLHYLNDGVHILAKMPKLALIALVYGLNPAIADRKGEGGAGLWTYLLPNMAEMKVSLKLQQKCMLLRKGLGSNSFLRKNLVLLYGAGFRPEIPGLSNDQINEALLTVDRTDKLRSSGKLAKHVLVRVSYLQQFAPNYYAEVAYKHYHKIALFLHKEKLLTNLTKEDMRSFDNFFQGIIDKRLLTYDNLCYNIANMTPDIAGYVLGFPVQDFVPNEEQIHDAIQLLQGLGKDGYCEHIKQLNKTYRFPVGPFTDIQADLVNEQDVFGEDIENYVAFDIVAFRDSKHIYRFTRLEFKQILDSKKNPYTNSWLPASVLNLIKSRVMTARDLGLPVARTLKEHLDCLEKGTFLISAQESQKEQQTSFHPTFYNPLFVLSRVVNDPTFRWRNPTFNDEGDIDDLPDLLHDPEEITDPLQRDNHATLTEMFIHYLREMDDEDGSQEDIID